MSPAFTTDEDRWRAVVERDRRADGAFFYAVRTTGVFCRPGCPSRRPRRAHVEFFAGVGAARSAGYRPCRRCRPEERSASERRTELMARICRRLEAAEEPPRLEQLAAEVGLSPWHLQRQFKQVVGVTPKQYHAAERMRRFRSGLAGDGSVTAAIYDAGFGSSSRAYDGVSARLGMTPSSYQRGGDGLVLRYAVAPCCLGQVLVAASERGICAIELGADRAVLESRLRARLPRARLEPADADFATIVTAVTGFLETPDRGLGLPLDIQGTAFEQRVWQALREIQPGATASYGEIAARLGAPRAARAVARACGTNRIAVAIPCHRVVRGDGGLGGYRWGKERKAELLRRERAAVKAPPPSGSSPRP